MERLVIEGSLRSEVEEFILKAPPAERSTWTNLKRVLDAISASEKPLYAERWWSELA